MARFERTYCSQCGGEFGPGDGGYSHCDIHEVERVLGYLAKDEAEIRATKANVVWADTMARATTLLRALRKE